MLPLAFLWGSSLPHRKSENTCGVVEGDEPPELGQVGGSYNPRMFSDWAMDYKRKVRGESTTSLAREDVLRGPLDPSL